MFKRLSATMALLGLLTLLLGGCAHLNTREQRMLSGGAIGAGVGAGLAVISGGHVLTGTALGAAAGAVGGLLLDESSRHQPHHHRR